jgi:hypothetical protein
MYTCDHVQRLFGRGRMYTLMHMFAHVGLYVISYSVLCEPARPPRLKGVCVCMCMYVMYVPICDNVFRILNQ